MSENVPSFEIFRLKNIRYTTKKSNWIIGQFPNVWKQQFYFKMIMAGQHSPPLIHLSRVNTDIEFDIKTVKLKLEISAKGQLQSKNTSIGTGFLENEHQSNFDQ